MLTDLATPELLAALAGNHTPSYRAQAFYGADITLEEVPLDERGSLDFNADAKVQASGSCYVKRDAHRDPVTGLPASLVPRELTDPLAPYGQEIALSRVVVAGEQEWVIPLGLYGIWDVPDMREHFRRFPSLDPANPDNDRRVVAGYELQLRLRDRFDPIQNADFLQPTAPTPGNSTWQEIQRISPIPIVQNVADAALPPALAYTDSRFDALTTLFENLGCEPHLTRQGSLTARPKDPWLTETVPVFEITGTIDVTEGMSADGVYNAVRVRSSTGANTILSIAQITGLGDPLRVGGPFNLGAPRTYGYASPLITDQAMADETAATILARVSTQKARRVTVTTLPNPLLEIGDYGVATDYRTGTVYTGSIASMSFSLNPFDPMTLDIIVATVDAV
jgi:hypothetical protein